MTPTPSIQDIFTFKAKPTSWQDIYFDSHAHIQYPEFTDKNQIIQNAKDVNLRGIVCVGTDINTSTESLDLHTQNSNYVFPTVGNHPYYADQDFEPIYNFAEQHKDKIIGIGETGLDYFKNKLPRDIQIKSFQEHAHLAKKLDLPLIIHLRDINQCWDDCWDILQNAKFPKAIFHCFTGSQKQAEQAWSQGYKTSFSLLVTYSQNTQLKEVYQNCPVQHLLIETDSPYLPPQNQKETLNQPSMLKLLNESI